MIAKSQGFVEGLLRRRDGITCTSVASFTVRIKKIPFASQNVRSTLQPNIFQSFAYIPAGFGGQAHEFYRDARDQRYALCRPCRPLPNLLLPRFHSKVETPFDHDLRSNNEKIREV